MNSYLSLLFVVLSLTACNRGVAIIAKNQSAADKRVEVVFPITFKVPNRLDSLQAWNLTDTRSYIASSDRYRYSVKVPVAVDIVRNMVSFTLKSQHETTVLGQVTSLQEIKKTLFVVGSDTLKYKRQGGCWIFMLK